MPRMKPAQIELSSTGDNFAGQLVELIAQIQAADDQIATINDRKKAIYRRARLLGFDQTILRRGLSEQRLDAAQLARRNIELDAFHRLLRAHENQLSLARTRAHVHVHEENPPKTEGENE